MGYAVGLRDEGVRRDCPLLFETGTAQTHDDEPLPPVICKRAFGKLSVMAITRFERITSELFEKNRKGMIVKT
jgi:hypothetical protein